VNYLARLFSSDDAAADSVVWCAALSVLGLLALMFYEAVAMGQRVGITEAGGGLATVIGAAGAVRVSRERFGKKTD
jgi:hypothetical protein